VGGYASQALAAVQSQQVFLLARPFIPRFAAVTDTATQGGQAVFDSYRNKHENVRMKREDGILDVALHSGGGTLVFNGYVHEALVKAKG
jgi:hypothetical protein